MKFLGTGIVWDKDNDRMLCEFKKTGLRQGELETFDKNLIKKLKELGYKYEVTEEDLEREEKKNKK